MESEAKNFLTESAKIRYYVMNLILRNGNQSVKIESSRDLAEKFSVARGTVRVALEKMVHENYLITRRGIGTFTNPTKAFCGTKKNPPKLIGIKIMGGDAFFFDPPAMRTLSVLLEEFSRKNFIVRFLSGSATSSEDCKYEMEHSYADGIVGYDCPPCILEEATKKIPVVGINTTGKGVPSILYSYRTAVENLRKNLNGKELFLCSELNLPETLESELKKNGLILKQGNFSDLTGYSKLPGGVFLPADFLSDFHAILKARGIDLQKCKPFVLTQSEEKLPCWLFEAPRREACRKAADMLDAMFRNEEVDKNCIMEFQLQYCN